MWADTDDLAKPLEEFAALHGRTLRSSSTKPIDLSYPNPRAGRDGRAFTQLRELVRDLDQDDLQYTPFGGGTLVRRRVAEAMNRRYALRLRHRDVVLTPGATAALSVTFAALFRPGDEILVVTPCWMDYPLYLRRSGLRMVEVPSGPGKRLDLDGLRAACGPRTAGVIISQPACPTGVLHSAAEIHGLADILHECERRFGRAPTLVSDEAHRDVIWDGRPVSLPMQVYPGTVSVYSYGKAWSLQGQRVGYLALGPGLDDRATRIERAMRSTGFAAPTALMQHLVMRIADWEPEHESLGDDQRWIRARLSDAGYDVVPGQGTAFVYVRCPEGVDDSEFVRRLAGLGVLAMPSSLFHEPGYFRLALNTARPQLAVAAQRLDQALNH